MKNLKLILGVVLLGLSLLLPLAGIWIATLPLSVPVKSAIIGLLTIGGPEVLAVVAVAVLGKETFELLREKLLSQLKHMAPQGSVSKTRYRIGLVLLLLTIVPSYIMGYAPQLLPDSSPMRLYVTIASDLIFIASLFVLGGDFWDKLKALFVYDARAVFPSRQIQI